MKIKKILKIIFSIIIGVAIGVWVTMICMDESGRLWGRKLVFEPEAIPFRANLEEVRIFAFITDKMIIIAQRSIPESKFSVQITYTDNQAPKHCSSSPNLNGILQSLESTKIKRHISAKELNMNYPVKIGYIEYRDPIMGEAPDPWELFTTKDHSKIAINILTDAYEVDMTPSLIEKIESICK